nr:hypothetical protein [Tanacetum cinerariifolium]
YEDIDGEYVAFGGNPKGGKIIGKGKTKKRVGLVMEKLFGIELEFMLVPQPSDPIKEVPDEAVHKELGDGLVRAATTASSLEAEQDSGNITKTQSETKNTQKKEVANQEDEIASLKRRVKVEKRNRSRTHGLKRLYKVGLITMVESSGNEESLGGEEVFVAGQNENVIKEVVDDAQDKGKGIMIEEPIKPKKKDQIRLDEEAAKKLQAAFDKEERLVIKKAKKEERANIALIEKWDVIQV